MRKKDNKNNKKTKKVSRALCAAMLSLTFGTAICVFNPQSAMAASSAVSSNQGVVKEISVTNSNFNSSSSTYSLSTSITGWSGQKTDSKTTSGIINVGSSFGTYMTTPYYLSNNNPLAKANDNNILMINSKTSTSGDFDAPQQWYKSNNITLEANSYYNFQVSFKADTNYYTNEKYNQKGETENVTISKSVFNGNDKDVTPFGKYISFSYKGKYYYLEKSLEEKGTTTSLSLTQEDLQNLTVFYDDNKDDGYYGVLLADNSSFFVAKADTTVGTKEKTVSVNDGAMLFACKNITYNATNSNNTYFDVKDGTPYYEQTTEYLPINSTPFGSIYLSGLKDENDKDVEIKFYEVTARDWTTFYFFVATGNNSQTISLDLCLGSKDHGSTGVVFFDDIHLLRYSENMFWKTYQSYQNVSYAQENGSDKKTIDCTQFCNLAQNKSLSEKDLRLNTEDNTTYNLDFESGIYNVNSGIKDWKKDENSTGNARVFDITSPNYFKSVTGYDFVGSDLSAKATLNNSKVEEISENKYALALWANDGFSKVTSNAIKIGANEIYKVTAKYKISEITTGSAYLCIAETNDVKTNYGLTKYTITEEKASSGINSNNTQEFLNDYGTIEFYVKGGQLYESAFKISLALGNESENATGCIIFDNITISKASTEEFSSASNSVTFGGTSENSPSITNGNFNNVTISSADSTHPFTADNWNVESGEGTTFAGVINTDSKAFAEYVALYKQYQENADTKDLRNPYIWAKNNPKNTSGLETPDNIMMLANVTSSNQTLKSDAFELSADSKLTFNYKTVSGNSNFKVSIKDEKGFTLFESDALSSNGIWEEYEVSFKAPSAKSNVYIQIDFGTEEENGKVSGYAYFDNFKFESTTVSQNSANLIDMTNYYLNLPTNKITDDIETSYTPAYTSNSKINAGIVTSTKFDSDSKFAIETEEPVNVFFLQSQGVGTQTITSNFNLDLSADTIYALSFKLKTFFNDNNLDEKTKYTYGAKIGLTGFDYASRLISSDEYSPYKIYFKPSEAASAQIYLALVCDQGISGSMAVYDIQFAPVEDETEFEEAQNKTADKNFDVNKDQVFVATTSDEEDDTTTDTDGSEGTDKNGSEFNWLAIPSLIFGIAIVIAIVGYFLRKVQFKKLERKKRESYDRNKSLNADFIKHKAAEEQKQQEQELSEIVEKFRTELNRIEEEHKTIILKLREQEQDSQTIKATDYEFKRFAQKRTVIAEKLDSLEHQLADIKSPEFLLNLERKIYAQEEMKRFMLERASKKREKSAKKAASKEKTNKEKTTTKDDVQEKQNQSNQKNSQENNKKGSKK